MQTGDHYAPALGRMRKQIVFEVDADMPGGIPYAEKNEITGTQIFFKHGVADLGLLMRVSRQPGVESGQIGRVDKSGAINAFF